MYKDERERFRALRLSSQDVCVDERLPRLADGAAVGDVGGVQVAVEEDPAEHVRHAHLEQQGKGGTAGSSALLHACALGLVAISRGVKEYVQGRELFLFVLF